jgi:hypothetical protein
MDDDTRVDLWGISEAYNAEFLHCGSTLRAVVYRTPGRPCESIRGRRLITLGTMV